jgi:hypothetical protein
MLIILVNQNTILVKLVSIINRYVSVYQAKIPVHEDFIGGSEALAALVYTAGKKRIVESTVIEMLYAIVLRRGPARTSFIVIFKRSHQPSIRGKSGPKNAA